MTQAFRLSARIVKEQRRPAQVEIRIASYTQAIQQRQIHMSNRVVIHTKFILGSGLTVDNMASAVRQCLN